MEKHRIKRVPVLEAGRLVDIVSRAYLVRRQVLKEVAQTGVDTVYVIITVEGGTVHLWGGLRSALEQKALRAAAKTINGVRKVDDHTSVIPPRLIGAKGGV